MTVFAATPEHAALVAGLLRDFNHEYDTTVPPLAELTARFGRLLARDDVIVLVAGTAAEPEGLALATLRPSPYFDGPLAVLDELYVVPHLRGQGRGTELLEALMTRLRARQCGEIHVNVDAPDVDARRFYERHGFTNNEVGTDDQMLLYLQEL